jgi:CHASE3 domain sensor protein
MFTKIAVLFLCICILLTVMSAAVFASGEEAAPAPEQAVADT